MGKSFYCNNCGEKVSEKDKSCPYCHCVFTAVKCPQCGFRGESHFFHDGCPVCGYLAATSRDEESLDAFPEDGTRRKKGWFSRLSPLAAAILLLLTLGLLVFLYFLYCKL